MCKKIKLISNIKNHPPGFGPRWTAGKNSRTLGDRASLRRVHDLLQKSYAATRSIVENHVNVLHYFRRDKLQRQQEKKKQAHKNSCLYTCSPRKTIVMVELRS